MDTRIARLRYKIYCTKKKEKLSIHCYVGHSWIRTFLFPNKVGYWLKQFNLELELCSGSLSMVWDLPGDMPSQILSSMEGMSFQLSVSMNYERCSADFECNVPFYFLSLGYQMRDMILPRTSRSKCWITFALLIEAGLMNWFPLLDLCTRNSSHMFTAGLINFFPIGLAYKE